MWVASGSSYVTEICAGSGIDWLLLDQEHAPNDLRTTLEQLQVLAGYPDVDVLASQVIDAGLYLKNLHQTGKLKTGLPSIGCACLARDR